MRVGLPARIWVYSMVTLAVLIVLCPLLWMLASALKTNAEIINPNAPLLPSQFHWQNLVAAWDAAPFGRFFVNTAVFSVITTAGQVATGLLAGYAFAMFEFPAKRILFYLVLAGLMIVQRGAGAGRAAARGRRLDQHLSGPHRAQPRLGAGLLPVPAVLPGRPG